MQSKKYVVGRGSMLDIAITAWRECHPDLELLPLEIGQDDDQEFKLSSLDDLTPTDATAFVAWDEQLLNFRRQELMGVLKAKGFAMPPLVCPGALIAANAKIAENCFVGRGTVLESGVQLGYNTVISAGCVIGAGSRIGNSVWLGRCVTLGDSVVLGTNTVLADGVRVGNRIEVGKLCLLGKAGEYELDVASRTYHHTAFKLPITIVGA